MWNHHNISPNALALEIDFLPEVRPQLPLQIERRLQRNLYPESITKRTDRKFYRCVPLLLLEGERRQRSRQC